MIFLAVFIEISVMRSTNFDCNDTEKILFVNITTLTKKKILEAIAKRIKNNKRTVIFTPNPQILLCAQKSASHRRLLECADINIPDGIGIVIASKIKGGRIQCRVSGIDLATTGGTRKGIRACSSNIKPHHYAMLEERLRLFNENH